MTRAIEFILADEAEKQEDGIAAAVLQHASQEIIGLKNRLAAAYRKNRWYDALIDAGVEDWDGYRDAMRHIWEEEHHDAD